MSLSAASLFRFDCIKMPIRMRLGAALTQFRSELGSEMVHPATHGLARNDDFALRKQILDVTQAQGEAEI